RLALVQGGRGEGELDVARGAGGVAQGERGAAVGGGGCDDETAHLGIGGQGGGSGQALGVAGDNHRGAAGEGGAGPAGGGGEGDRHARNRTTALLHQDLEGDGEGAVDDGALAVAGLAGGEGRLDLEGPDVAA